MYRSKEDKTWSGSKFKGIEEFIEPCECGFSMIDELQKVFEELFNVKTKIENDIISIVN